MYYLIRFILIGYNKQFQTKFLYVGLQQIKIYNQVFGIISNYR